MTLDDTLMIVLRAVQPHIHKDVSDPIALALAFGEMKRLFAEEPNAEAAFIAAVQAVVQAARVGWIKP